MWQETRCILSRKKIYVRAGVCIHRRFVDNHVHGTYVRPFRCIRGFHFVCSSYGKSLPYKNYFCANKFSDPLGDFFY